MKRRPLILSAPWLLAGCGASLLPKPGGESERYRLDDLAGEAAAAAPMPGCTPGAPGAATLLVAVPSAAAGFDSNRMVYVREPQRLQAFAQSEWVDTPARLLAPLIVRALEQSGTFCAVLMAPAAAVTSMRLVTELIRLQQDFSTQPSQVRLSLRAWLIDTRTRQVLAWQVFDQTSVAATDTAAGGAAAAQQASLRLVQKLALFCAATVEGSSTASVRSLPR